MSQGPRLPLDAQERALREALPRLHGRGHPADGVDDRILAAARLASGDTPARAALPRRWLAPVGVAATLVVAAGLAWRLLPPDAAAPNQQEVAASTPAPSAAETSPLPQAPAEQAAPVPVARERPLPRDTPQAGRRGAAKPATDAVADVAEAPPSAPVPAPATMPAQRAAPTAVAAAEAATVQAAESRAARDASAGFPTERVATPAPSPPPSAQVDSGVERSAGAAPAPAPPIADDDVPPATVDAPGVRDAWLRRIRELVADGRTDEARESLAVFRKRYPNAVVPPELQALEPPPRD